MIAWFLWYDCKKQTVEIASDLTIVEKEQLTEIIADTIIQISGRVCRIILDFS